MAADWQIKTKNKIHGDYTYDQLQRLVAAGKLKRQTAVRPVGGTIWMAAESVPGLFGEFQDVHHSAQSPSASEAVVAVGDTSDDWQQADEIQSQPVAFEEEDASRKSDTFRPLMVTGYRRQLLAFEPKSIIDLLDWRFEKYLTPWIIRIAWLAILVLAGTVLLYFSVETVYKAVFNEPLSDHLPGLRDILKDDPPRFRQVGGPREKVVVEFRPGEFVNRLVGALGKLLAVSIVAIFTVLWLRVACESVIVIFNIATSLRRLEELSEPIQN